MLKKKKKDDAEFPEVLNDADENNPHIQEMEQQDDSGVETGEPEVSSAEDLLKQEISLANDKYLRLYAEFDNFRRRTQKERVELLQTAGREVILSLLPVVDDFERAVRSMENATDINAVKEGVVLVQNKLNSILKQKGLKEMESKGAEFDPEIHEAITNIPAPTPDLKNKVVDELEKGYYLGDKVIRFAKVIVGS